MSSEAPGRRGRLFIISGPSGSGKSTIVRNLLSSIPTMEYSVSTTTRPMRAGETNGVEYHFTNVEEFRRLIDAGEFIEHAQVHGNYYGTRYSTVERTLAAGRDLLLDIDVQGAREIRKRAPEAISIFLMPPSMRTLEQRLRARATDTDETIAARLRNAEQEMLQAKDYDYVIVNDNIEAASARLAEIIKVAGA